MKTKLFDSLKDQFPHLLTLPYPQPGDFVCSYFNNMKNGIFIDIGAHDGLQMSNTFFLEKFLGWTGICCEPNPKVFKELKNNRECICLPDAVSDQVGKIDFLFCEGYTEMLSGIEKNYEPHHYERLLNEINIYGGSFSKIQVQTKTLQMILDENNVSNIDYLSIDTEGSELVVVQGIDFSKTYIRLISFEDNRGDLVKKFLLSNGYRELGKICGDWFFEKEEKL